MKRYYISAVLGDGSRDNPYRAAVQDTGVNHVSVIPTDANGVPTSPWCLVLVNATSHAALLADNRIDACPDVALDLKLSAIKPSTWTQFATRVALRNIDLSVFSASGNSADAFRDVIRHLGQSLQASFNENSFDVSE